MKYEIIITQRARKQIRKLSKSTITQMAKKIDLLAEDPRPSGCKKLIGYKNIWRIRMGSYRVIYTIMNQRLIIKVLEATHRKDAY